jgi:5'-nucleotidase
MKILLTNDDGILAPGLAALYRVMADLGEVTVVAPAAPQSASGHGITVTGPLATEKVHVEQQFWGISVAGRPADCVKLAMRALMDGPADLVLSGINPGANVGINVLYSGTVAAAAEGAMLGARAVAFSLDARGELDFDRAARYCRAVLDKLLAGGLAPGELVNVNIPNMDRGRPKGVRIARQATAALRESYESQVDPLGRLWYWLGEQFSFADPPADTDVVALRQGCIAVTPLHVDLTDSRRLGPLAQLPWDGTIEGCD